MNYQPQHSLIIPEHLDGDQFVFESHAPGVMECAHFHAHLEILFLENCEAEYLINGQSIFVPEGRLTFFWANIPHRLSKLRGKGKVYIANIPLSFFLGLLLPDQMREQILVGSVLQSYPSSSVTVDVVKRWEREFCPDEPVLVNILQDDIGLYLRRISHQGWVQAKLATVGDKTSRNISMRKLQHTSHMISFINQYFGESLSVERVASRVGLQPNYALGVFSAVMGVSIKQYILRQRLQAAQRLLTERDDKIAAVAFECGFGSLSRFYEVFTRHFGLSPSKFRRAVRGGK